MNSRFACRCFYVTLILEGRLLTDTSVECTPLGERRFLYLLAYLNHWCQRHIHKGRQKSEIWGSNMFRIISWKRPKLQLNHRTTTIQNHLIWMNESPTTRDLKKKPYWDWKGGRDGEWAAPMSTCGRYNQEGYLGCRGPSWGVRGPSPAPGLPSQSSGARKRSSHNFWLEK